MGIKRGDIFLVGLDPTIGKDVAGHCGFARQIQ